MKGLLHYLMLLVKATLFKNILYLKRYWLNTLFGVIIMALVFVAITYGISILSSSYIHEESTSLISGYVCWMFMTASFSTMVNNITNEASLGTLEQLYINSKYFTLTLLAQAFSNFITYWIQFMLLILIIVLLQLAPAYIITGYVLYLPLFFIGTLSLWGCGLVVAALALEYKNVSSIYTALSTILFGAISYLSQNYDNWQLDLVPFASASHNFSMFLQGELDINWGSVCKIMLNSVLYILIGVYFFRRGVVRSKKFANFAKH